jgi:hypothetical protein
MRAPLGELNANSSSAEVDPASGPESDSESKAEYSMAGRAPDAYQVGELVDVLDTVDKWCEGQIVEVGREP